MGQHPDRTSRRAASARERDRSGATGEPWLTGRRRDLCRPAQLPRGAPLSEDAIVVQLSNRRLFQASARVLDAVADELAQAMARTGDGPPIPAGGPTGGDHDYSLNEM